MAKYRYQLKPLEHMMATQFADASIPGGFSPVTKNVKVFQHGVRKRWGYTLDRSLGSTLYSTACLQAANGQRYTMYLTDADLAVRKTGTSETFAYATEAYTTGAVTGITGAVVTGNVWCQWQASSGLAAGDKLIMAADENASIEPDTNWGTILTVDSDTQITLSAAYTGATTVGNYKTRKVYSLPTSERWSWTMVDDKFIFTNGNTNVQYIAAGGTAAADVNATYAVKARYCTAFADRLILADSYSSGLRNPVQVQYSANTSVLEFDAGTDATAGSFELLETEDYITGLGRVGSLLGVFKRDSVTFYERSGDSTSPLRRYNISTGIGSSAPYSIVEALGTVVFLGKDDFYLINGDHPEPIGESMRYKFYDIVPETEAGNTWGFVNPAENEIVWIANTSEGKYAFVWDYKYKEWMLYKFPVDITGAGMGAI
jgi:hypothetical protein